MLESQSHMNEEYLLDVPFTAEEVSTAVSKLKKKKAPGTSESWRRGCCDLANEYPQCCSGVRVSACSLEEGS